MDLDGRIWFSKFPKLRTSKYPHQGKIDEEMSDLGGVGLLANPSKGASLFREKGELCVLSNFLKETLNEFWL